MMQLQAQQLSIGYSGRIVGRDLSLHARPGEVLCLLGPNGCGKTTLFKTLLGLLPALNGCITIGGEDVSRLRRRELARRMAYVPQGQSGVFPYTTLDFVLMGRVAHRGLFAAPKQQDREISRQALATLGIEGLAGRAVTELSGGQRQLVMIARAVAQSAPIIILDEPTASLDFGNQVMVLSIVRQLAESGATVILSTHDPDHAFGIAGRVVLMREGEIVAQGQTRDILTPARLRSVYEVDVAVEDLANGQTICVPVYKF